MTRIRPGGKSAAQLAADPALRAALEPNPFRADATRLRGWRAALDKVATSPADVLILGDSWSDEVSGPRWPTTLRTVLQARYNPAGVTGGIGYRPANASVFAYGGSVSDRTDLGLGRYCKRLNTNATVTFTVPGTGADILYTKGALGGNASYTVNGGTATVVNTFQSSATPSTSGAVIALRGLTPGSVIVLTATSASVFFEGVAFYNGDETKGVRLWNGGRSGYRSADHIDATEVAYGPYGTVKPELLIVELGVNDLGGGGAGVPVAPATSAANLLALVNAVRARCTTPPSVLLWLPPQTTPTAAPVAAWADYLAAYEAMAKADGQIAIFDVGAVLGDLSAATDPYGVGSGDHVHPSGTGYLMLADALYALLATPPTGGGSTQSAAATPTAPTLATLHGLAGLSVDPAITTSTVTLTAGQARTAKIGAVPGATLSQVLFSVTTAAVGTTDAVAVYDSSGNQLATASGTFFAAVANATVTLPSFTVPTNGVVVVAVLTSGGTTQPAFRSSSSTAGSTTNFGLGAGLMRSGTFGSGLSALPGTLPAQGAASPVALVGLN